MAMKKKKGIKITVQVIIIKTEGKQRTETE